LHRGNRGACRKGAVRVSGVSGRDIKGKKERARVDTEKSIHESERQNESYRGAGERGKRQKNTRSNQEANGATGEINFNRAVARSGRGSPQGQAVVKG